MATATTGKRFFQPLFYLCAFLLSSLLAHAQSGDLDTSFGSSGIVISNAGSGSPSEGRAITIQSDGKILVAGKGINHANGESNFALLRYLSDGSLDSTFASDGNVSTDINASLAEDEAYAMATQSDGKIVVAGHTHNTSTGYKEFALVRYDSNGSLDTSFGTNGFAVTEINASGEDEAYAMAVQDDDKIIVAGSSNEDFALVRYGSSGSLDTSFGTNGIVTTDINASSADYIRAVAIQSDGKIVVAGYIINAGDNYAALARYSSAGSLDTGFGTNGIVTTSINGNNSDYIYAVALQDDGNKIVVAGCSYSGSNNDITLVQYDSSDGSLDTSFGTNGIVTTDIDSTDDCANTLAVQDDGKIIVAGYASNSSTGYYDFALARYESDGSLDTSFGSGGKVTTTVASNGGKVASVALQDDGNIVVVGSSNGGDFDGVTLARYLGDSSSSSSAALKTAAHGGVAQLVYADNSIVYNLDSDLGGLTNSTVEAWVFLNSMTSNNEVFLTNSTTPFGIRINTSGQIEGVNGSNQNAFTASGSIQDGEWNHIAMAYEGALAAAEEVKIYINGVKSTLSTDPFETSSTYPASAGVESKTRLDGMIDELRIWNTTRTSAEINASMKQQLSGSESGLVAYYRFDEIFGKTVKDFTGSHDGKTEGNVTRLNFLGDGLEFDGSGDKVTLPTSVYETHLEGGSAFSIAYWFKGTNHRSAVRFQDSTNYVIAGYGTEHCVISSDGGTTSGLGPIDIADDQWHYAACTWEKNKLNGFRAYVDGELTASRNSSDTVLPTISPVTTSMLGSENTSAENLNGSLAQVSIWNRVLSQGEIRKIMHGSLEGDESGLVGYWPLNEGTGSTAHDYSDNGGNHGTITGAEWNTTAPDINGSSLTFYPGILQSYSTVIDNNTSQPVIEFSTTPGDGTYGFYGDYNLSWFFEIEDYDTAGPVSFTLKGTDDAYDESVSVTITRSTNTAGFKLNLNNINLSEHNITEVWLIGQDGNDDNLSIAIESNISDGDHDFGPFPVYADQNYSLAIEANGSTWWYNFNGNVIVGSSDGSSYYQGSMASNDDNELTVDASSGQWFSSSAAPAAPSGLTGSYAANCVTLTWTDNSSDEDGFNIHRDGDEINNTIASDSTTYTDCTVASGSSYDYIVYADNSFGQSGSNTFSITIPSSTTHYITVATQAALEGNLSMVSSGDVINLEGLGGQTITLSSGPLVISQSITIEGNSSKGIEISGAGSYQIFEIASGASVDLKDLNLTNGNTNSSDTGGCITNKGTLELENVQLHNCQSSEGGGAINNNTGGKLIVRRSWFHNNTATASTNGGAILNSGSLQVERTVLTDNDAEYGGGIYTDGDANITNTTLSGNNAANMGGALYASVGSTVYLEASTVANNTGSYSLKSYGTTNLFDTILDNNGYDSYGLTSLGYNIFDDNASYVATLQSSDLSDTDPMLDALSWPEGSSRPILPLLKDSPAINTGSCAATTGTLTKDGRNFNRPSDSLNASGSYDYEKCDVGAYEYATSVTLELKNLSATLSAAVITGQNGNQETFDLPLPVLHNATSGYDYLYAEVYNPDHNFSLAVTTSGGTWYYRFSDSSWQTTTDGSSDYQTELNASQDFLSLDMTDIIDGASTSSIGTGNETSSIISSAASQVVSSATNSVSSSSVAPIVITSSAASQTPSSTSSVSSIYIPSYASSSSSSISDLDSLAEDIAEESLDDGNTGGTLSIGNTDDTNNTASASSDAGGASSSASSTLTYSTTISWENDDTDISGDESDNTIALTQTTTNEETGTQSTTTTIVPAEFLTEENSISEGEQENLVIQVNIATNNSDGSSTGQTILIPDGSSVIMKENGGVSVTLSKEEPIADEETGETVQAFSLSLSNDGETQTHVTLNATITDAATQSSSSVSREVDTGTASGSINTDLAADGTIKIQKTTTNSEEGETKTFIEMKPNGEVNAFIQASGGATYRIRIPKEALHGLAQQLAMDVDTIMNSITRTNNQMLRDSYQDLLALLNTFESSRNFVVFDRTGDYDTVIADEQNTSSSFSSTSSSFFSSSTSSAGISSFPGFSSASSSSIYSFSYRYQRSDYLSAPQDLSGYSHIELIPLDSVTAFEEIQWESGERVIRTTDKDALVLLDNALYQLEAGTYYLLPSQVEGESISQNITGTTNTRGAEILSSDENLNLQAGWNLITIPVATPIAATYDSTKITFYNETVPLDSITVDSGRSEHIFSYQQAYGWQTNPPAFSKTEGFWLYLKKTQQLDLSTPASYKPTYSTLEQGWHLLGTGSRIRYLHKTDGIESVYSFQGEENWIKNPNNLYTGEGFWIYKKSDSTTRSETGGSAKAIYNQQAITLYPDWNLITSPNQENVDFSDSALAPLTTTWSYDSTAGTWQRDAHLLKAGQGLWLNFDSKSVDTLEIAHLSDYCLNADALPAGWHLLGSGSAFDPASLPSDEIYLFDSSTQQWLTNPDSVPRGHGFWSRIETETSLNDLNLSQLIISCD